METKGYTIRLRPKSVQHLETLQRLAQRELTPSEVIADALSIALEDAHGEIHRRIHLGHFVGGTCPLCGYRYTTEAKAAWELQPGSDPDHPNLVAPQADIDLDRIQANDAVKRLYQGPLENRVAGQVILGSYTGD